MNKTVDVLGKPVEVTITHRGVKALQKLNGPVSAEMELLFSCMLRKRVLIREGKKADSVPVMENLNLFFHAVMTDHCNLSDYESLADIPITDFPTTKQAQLVPKWLKIDFKSGKWRGDFGYTKTG